MSKVLLVDGEPFVLQTLRRLLKAGGLTNEVVAVGSGADGLAQLETGGFVAVISDLNMPRMNGTEFLKQVAARWPHIVRGSMSGEPPMPHWTSSKAWLEFEKPCRFDAFLSGTRSMVELAELASDSQITDLFAAMSALQVADSKLSFDGRGCGRRWFEAFAMVGGIGASGSSKTVMSSMANEASEALAILVGAFEAVGRAGYAVDNLWLAAIREGFDADIRDDERGLFAARISAIASRIGTMAKIVHPCRIADSDVAAALLWKWGFTSEIVAPILAQSRPELAPFQRSDSVVRNNDRGSLPLVSAGRYSTL
jgi:hypothetical protein